VRHTRPGTCNTRDGISLHYTIHGVDDGRKGRPKVVLVHSLAMAGDVWGPVAEQLSDNADVLTFDCRGHGASTRAPGPYQLETFGRDLADLVDALGWDRIHLAGASMGGNVSLQFAVLYPQRVLTLGLIDTTAWYGPDAQKNWSDRAAKAKEKGLAGMIEFQETRWFTDAFRAQNTARAALCRRLFLANSVDSFVATCGMLGGFDLRSKLSSLRMPTAILVGEEDYATPVAMAQALHDGITGSTLTVIPKARHLTFVEVPEVITRALSELQAGVPYSA
jgi:3-oxoadipate enol-lactonase